MGTATSQDRRYAWRVLSVTTLGMLLAGLNTSTLDVGLPVVARHFHAGATAAAWALLAYMVVNTVLILAFGRLADIAGRRRLYIAGLATLTLASFGCGLAPSIDVLDGLRALQAVGAAAIITNTTAQLTDAFPSDLLSVGLGLNVTFSAAAQVLGPVLGGFLATDLGWRAVFWFNVPIGAAGVVWAWMSLRRSSAGASGEPFDLAGALLSLVAVGGLVVALSEGGALGWGSAPVLLGGAAFVAAAPAFVALQLRRRHPLVDLSLFRERERLMAYVSVGLLALARFAVVLLLSLYLQAAQGLDAAQAGVRVIPVAAGMMLVSPLAGRLARRYPPRALCTAGLAVLGGGLVELGIVLQPTTAYPAIAAGLAAVGVGTGIFMTPNTSSIMTSVSAARRGIANGARSMMQNTGYVVSVALSLGIVTSTLAPAEKRAAYAGTLSRLPHAALASFTSGYHHALFVLAALAGLGLVASAVRRGRPR